jgi:capsular polysaccharide biosynthesis protein
MTLLSDWGFERYHPEELSFAEQVTLFSNAEAIVSPHGSGLMNQIFADDAVIIELMGKKKTITSPATEYFYAEGLGHDYACVPGEAIGPDLQTDVSGLATVLEKLLEKP